MDSSILPLHLGGGTRLSLFGLCPSLSAKPFTARRSLQATAALHSDSSTPSQPQAERTSPYRWSTGARVTLTSEHGAPQTPQQRIAHGLDTSLSPRSSAMAWLLHREPASVLSDDGRTSSACSVDGDHGVSPCSYLGASEPSAAGPIYGEPGTDASPGTGQFQSPSACSSSVLDRCDTNELRLTQREHRRACGVHVIVCRRAGGSSGSAAS